MRRESPFRPPRRPRRLPLRFEALEDRLQPNDMLGLGFALLADWSPFDLRAAEQPQLVRTDPQGASDLLVKHEQAATAPFEFRAESRTEQAVVETSEYVSDGGAAQMFAAVNSQAAPFGDTLALALGQGRQARGIPQRLLDALRNLGNQTGVGVVEGGNIGAGAAPRGAQALGQPARRVEQVQGDLARIVGLLGGKTQAGQGEGGAGIAQVTIMNGNTSVTVDTFGRAGHTAGGGLNLGAGFLAGPSPPAANLCEHTNFIGTGAGIVPIVAANCEVVLPITIVKPDVAISQVGCQEKLITYAHVVVGADQTWYTVVVIDAQRPNCFYSYSDYDLYGFADNGGSWQGGNARFVVRNNLTNPGVHFTFTDLLGTYNSWEHDVFPVLRNKIDAFQQCTPLANAPSLVNGDWTGAFHWDLVAGQNVLLYFHSRDDAAPFP